MENKLLNLKETMDYLHVSKSSLHKWDKEGKLVAIRTAGGHRRYRLSDLKAFRGEEGKHNNDNEKSSNVIRVVTYARCSTTVQKQHGDIDRQSQRLVEYSVAKNYKVEYIIKDIGSGLNDLRKGFVRLCNLVIEGKVDKVIIEYKDRLTRFQFNLIKMFFKSYGVEIELTDKRDYTEQEELVNDMIMLLASFSGKVYSARARENKKKNKNI